MEFDVRVIRVLLNLSMEEFAKELGTTRQTISNWEKGRSKITKIGKMAIGYAVEHYHKNAPSERLKIIEEMFKGL